MVAIHTSPLAGRSPAADFFLTRVLGRTAVPFFFMVTGRFALSGPEAARRFCRKTLLLYGAASALYLPLAWYAGRFQGLDLGGALKLLVWDGIYYHLWYLPACLMGMGVAWALRGLPKGAGLAAASVLYLLGLLGDAYWGLTEQIPWLEQGYQLGFRVFTYTRNGLFMAPLFLLLGRALGDGRRLPGQSACLAGALAGLAAMTGEAFALKAAGFMRHDSMYLALPWTCGCLFAWLWQIPAPPRPALRRLCGWVYLLHPALIAAVRLAAKGLGLVPLLVEDNLIHALAVALLSLAAGGCLVLAGMRPSPTGRAWIELDLSALAHNLAALRQALPPGCVLMAAVKANAYGHGAVPVAKALRRMGVGAFCVATLKEGIQLRRWGVMGEILVLGYTHPRDLALLRLWRLSQTVVDAAYARALNQSGGRTRVHIALDTGMGRLGLNPRDLDGLQALFAMKGLKVKGLFTHLCAAESRDAESRAYTLAQADAFYYAAHNLEERGIRLPKLHLLASGGILNYPEFAEEMVRPGIALYGMTGEGPCASLRPVLSLKARVVTVRRLRPGQRAGYGLAFTARRETDVAVISIGYGDGVPRALSQGRGRVLLNGREAPILGRICMDQLLADATGIPGVRQGGVAVLIGHWGPCRIEAWDWAQAADTIPNEVLSRLAARLPRLTRPGQWEEPGAPPS